ncbi:NAD(P)-binding protein [Cucurbitaria berberidis CBS 394.84]|uniref:NAD(P)-binding protein n=1 Tax=Cucurbitaria berberidis CBS 394.84 TaxID=1168544 RepID=A0A9P4LE69_9PLEO|nr:NAD(P)-binding protein [Cucurbitaria berberidis CBS 394.84]KAF1850819.1 NAD(P)-binding protein [Cucurbitaria berberidis CBS 394.84]
MSAHLEEQASTQAGMLFNTKRQLFQRVPPIPPAIDLAGKTVLVTGSNIGLGLECSRQFLNLRPSRLIMAVRSLPKGEAAAVSLRAEFPDAKIEVWQLDMESFRSVQAFAAKCEQELDRLHVAVLNAALGKFKFDRTEEGCNRETTIQVNYLSTTLLAILLIPKMKPSASSSGPGRLTMITSDASLWVKLKDAGSGGLLDSIDRPENFDGFEQYSRSKLLINMFGARLADFLDPDEVIVNCCNPGAVKGTAFMRNADSWFFKTAISLIMRIVGRTMVDGARVYVHSCLVLGKKSHGSFTDWQIRAWPETMYGALGYELGTKVWNETIEELRFAGVENVVGRVGK